jgi:tRNA/tmRNA/rRNA uracil-C5-methylase (TrmA/RlmC/RlmD family)
MLANLLASIVVIQLLVDTVGLTYYFYSSPNSVRRRRHAKAGMGRLSNTENGSFHAASARMEATHQYTAECSTCGTTRDFESDSEEGLRKELQQARWRPTASTVTGPPGETLIDWRCPNCDADEAAYRERAQLIIDATLRELGIGVDIDTTEYLKMESVRAVAPEVHESLQNIVKIIRHLAVVPAPQRSREDLLTMTTARELHVRQVAMWVSQHAG